MRNGLLALVLLLGCDGDNSSDADDGGAAGPELYTPCENPDNSDCADGLTCDLLTRMCTRQCSIDSSCTSDDVVGRCLSIYDSFAPGEILDQICIVACTEHAAPCDAQGIPDAECITFTNGEGPVEHACSFPH